MSWDSFDGTFDSGSVAAGLTGVGEGFASLNGGIVEGEVTTTGSPSEAPRSEDPLSVFRAANQKIAVARPSRMKRLAIRRALVAFCNRWLIGAGGQLVSAS
jgi:hypothetical protein